MMTPKSRRTRFIYFVIFALIFIAIVPFILLYSLGYNFGKNFSLLKTGGIYVYASQTGVDVSIDGTLDNTTSIFQRGILIKDLRPNNYSIKVAKEGYLEWNKNIKVVGEKVSEAYPFLIPKNIVATSVPAQIFKIVATTSVPSVNPEYRSLNLLFSTSTKTLADIATEKANRLDLVLKASSTYITASSTFIENKKLIAVKNGDEIHAVWIGNKEDTPFYFCLNKDDVCSKDFVIYSKPGVVAFDFYPSRNDIIFVEVDARLYVVELDKRSPQNIVEIYKSPTGQKFEFKVVDNDTLAIKEGKKITKLSLIYAK